jgi:hypothetical protein
LKLDGRLPEAVLIALVRSRIEYIQERAWRHDLHSRVLPEIKKRPITGDDVRRASLERRGDVLVVVRVFADAGELLCARNQVRQHDEVLEPELRISATEQLAYLRVRQGA